MIGFSGTRPSLIGESIRRTELVGNCKTIVVGLLRHFGPGSVLREGPVWRMTILPLGAGSVLGAIIGALALGLVPSQALKIGLGIILIWSAWGVFRQLPSNNPTTHE